MNHDDDFLDDMDNDEPTDDEIESLLQGAFTPEGHDDVAHALAALRGLEPTQPQVPVGPALAEFVSRPTTPASVQEPASVVLEPAQPAMSPPPRRTRAMATRFPSTLSAKMALTGGVLIAALTGAHVADLVDVPLLPDHDNRVEVVMADGGTSTASSNEAPVGPTAPPQDETTPSDTAPELNMNFDDGTIEIQLGDISLSVAVDITNGEARVDVEIEGVSAACEAAFEALEDVTDPAAFEAAGAEIEVACADDFEGLEFDPGSLAFGNRDFFEDFDPGQLEKFFEDFNPEDLDKFFEDFNPEDLDKFFQDFNPEDLDKFFQDFNPEDLDKFFQDFNLEDLEKFFEDFDPDAFGEGGFGFFLDDLENFDPGQLDKFFEDFDPEDLGKFFEDFDPGNLLPPEAQAELDRFFEDFDPGQLEKFFEDFDPGNLLPPEAQAELDRFFEDFDPEDLDKFFEDFNPEDLDKFFEDFNPSRGDEEVDA